VSPVDRDRHAEYRARAERARKLGFTGVYDVRGRGGVRAATDVRSLDLHDALPPAAREARIGSLHAVADVRAGVPEEVALRRAGIDEATARTWLREAWDRPADRELRPMLAITRDGLVPATPRGSRAASTIAEHAAAVGHYLRTGDASGLARFRGVRVARMLLETRTAVLDRLAAAGALAVEDLYRG